MTKHELIVTLRRELHCVMAERLAAKRDPATLRARSALKRFQAARMMTTHADLLASRESHAAAQFFLDDLYGDEDLSQRDTDIERIIPMMERLLPLPALAAITEAVVLDALSESMDAQMADLLGESFAEADYAQAYRQVMQRADRERQILHIQSLGNALCELVRVPLIGATIAMMRGPAKIAGLSELHSFLDRGFCAFKVMKRPYAFVTSIVSRETAIMNNLYSGRPHPFLLESLQPTEN